MIATAPQKPAAAYTAMADALGDAYFLRRPPEPPGETSKGIGPGMRLEVIGSDSVSTQWDLTHADWLLLKVAFVGRDDLWVRLIRDWS